MSSAAPALAQRSFALAAILWGGFIGGSFDMTFALLFYGLRRGIPLAKIPQSIASGLLGADAYSGGTATVVLGFCLHYFIAMSAATVYYFASRKISFLRRNAVVSGLLYGAAIYSFMNFVVLPLSAVPSIHHTLLNVSADLTVHVLLIGPSIALATRKFAGELV
ncbi:MAG TPA: hypothetical protein VH437_16635 [Terriglobales bacterium]|jgi:hypothetical protein